MKVRCNGLDQLRLIANDGHNQEFYNSGNSFQWFGRSSKEIPSGEWSIYVVDLELLASEYYTPNDKSVERVSYGLHFQNNGLNETEDFIEYIDIAYFAVCDDWSEVVSITGDEQVLYTDWKNPGADVLKNPDGTCVKCGIGLLLDEGDKLTFGCPGCKEVKKILTIPEEVNYYSAPSYYYNNWSAGLNGYTLCKPVGDFAYDEEGDCVYSHINTYRGASFEFTNGTCTPDRGFAVNGLTSDSDKVIDAGDKIKGGSGAFMVLKMRATDIEYVDLIVNGDDDGGKVLSSSAIRRATKDISDDEWTVYVIDIAKLAAEHYSANDATVTNICVALRIDEDEFNASTGVGNGGTESLDIAYFAICDNWDEVADVVGDEKVLYTDWKTPANDKIYTSAGVEACQHDWGAYQSDATTHWKGECSLCGESIAPREHNWKYYKNTRVCNTCGVIERCALNGIHYEITPEGHRVKETCDICRFTVQTSPDPHDWEYGPLNRHCTTCKYSEECDGDHYTASEDGHIVKESCDICQIVESTTSQSHTWSYGVKSRECDQCGYVETCDKDHIEFDATGHRIKENCDICQLTKQTEMTEHTKDKGIFITKGEKTTTYTYGCTVCGYGEDTWTVDNSINFYSVPGLQVNNYNTGANTGGDTANGQYIRAINEYTDSESGESFLFNRIRFNATGSVKFSNGSQDPTRFINLTDKIDGSGRFAVLKIRVGGVSVGSFFFGAYDGNGNPNSADNVFRDGYNDRGANKLPIDKWVTYVIDLTGVNANYYKAENDKLTKASFGMQIQHGKGGTDTDYIDFAYFAVCDDMEEVAQVVGDDEIEFLKSWSGASLSITCHKGEHNFKDGEYVCQDCGYKVVCEDEDGHFVITATGHRATEDCLVCGITAQDAEVPHSDFVFDFNEGTYSYTCSVCGY